jgi:hypothetical protein
MGTYSFFPSFGMLLYSYGGHIVEGRGEGRKKNQKKKKGPFSSGALTEHETTTPTAEATPLVALFVSEASR